MIVLCAVIWVHVCIPERYLHATTVFDMTVHEKTLEPSEIRRLGVEIDVYGTDDLKDFGTAGANRVCEEGHCVYYRKRCDSDGQLCEYEGGFNAAGSPRAFDEWSMKITAKSASALRRAEAALFLDLSDFGSKEKIFLPLSALDVLSPSTNLFYCKPDVRMQGCLTPQQARRMRFGHD